MQTRRLGKTDIQISEVGLGAWQLGADWGTPVSEETAKAILQQSIDTGVNFIDTADVYGGGRSETLIGAFLQEAKAAGAGAITVATKQGRSAGWDDSYDVMKAHAVASIKRFGVEVIDLLQLHCIPFSTLKRGVVFDNLERLQAEGIIRFAGVSVESAQEGLYCLQHPIVSALQVIYNVFRQKLDERLLPQAQAADVGILARVPLASGLLTGKLSAGHIFPENDHRHYNADGKVFNVGETFAGVPFAAGVSLAQKVGEILQPSTQRTQAQLALRWILDNPAVSTVIPGASSPAQALANGQVSTQAPLNRAQHKQLKALYDTQVKDKIRGPY